jgi:hypothetical protein
MAAPSTIEGFFALKEWLKNIRYVMEGWWPVMELKRRRQPCHKPVI